MNYPMLMKNAAEEEAKTLAIQAAFHEITHTEKTPEKCLAAVRLSGYMLRHVPKGMQDYRMCLEAVRSYGRALKHVSKKLLQPELFLEAIRQDGFALEYVPDWNKTLELCTEAVLQIASRCTGWARIERNVFEYVPTHFLSKDLYETAVKHNGVMLKFVPEDGKSEELCALAVSLVPVTLEFVPAPIASRDLVKAAVDADWRAFAHAPQKMYTMANCVKVFERASRELDEKLNAQANPPYRAVKEDEVKFIPDIYEELPYIGISGYAKQIAQRIQAKKRQDTRIAALERRLGVRKVSHKGYDADSRVFYIQEDMLRREENDSYDWDEGDRLEFASFREFYEFLDGDLSGASLGKYDFDGINVHDYNLDGIAVSTEKLVQLGLYDQTFYENNIAGDPEGLRLLFSAENETTRPEMVLHETDLDFLQDASPVKHGEGRLWEDSFLKIYYISDLHVNHKLQKEFPHHATPEDVRRYVWKMIFSLGNNIEGSSIFDSFLMIAGDISFNFTISEMVLTELSRCFPQPNRIILVLGNHELWNATAGGVPSPHGPDADEIVAQYRALCNRLGLILLHNDLLIIRNTNHPQRKQVRLIPETQLREMDEEELHAACVNGSLVVLGGLGFSGLNDEFNAANRLYRYTLRSREADRKQSQRFEFVYNKLKQAAGRERVIVLTHTPKKDWSNQAHHEGWIYVNGHTHRNEYHCGVEKTVYADNQIGYYSTSIGLKHFYVSGCYDIFRNIEDGIHTINHEQYLDFNRGQNIIATFNRSGAILMLKNQDVYCFIYQNPETEKNYLLNGGQISQLEHESLLYYFDRLPCYASATKTLFTSYNRLLKTLSNAVKAFGGGGTVHGCIVDIDCLNHLYLNPIDGSVTPYYALSIVDKHVYKSVRTLLKNHCPELYINYITLLGNSDETAALLEGKENIHMVELARFAHEIPEFVSDTSMYAPSRTMKRLQYLTEANVVRLWNDRIIEMHERLFKEPLPHSQKAIATT